MYFYVPTGFKNLKSLLHILETNKYGVDGVSNESAALEFRKRQYLLYKGIVLLIEQGSGDSSLFYYKKMISQTILELSCMKFLILIFFVIMQILFNGCIQCSHFFLA